MNMFIIQYFRVNNDFQKIFKTYILSNQFVLGGLFCIKMVQVYTTHDSKLYCYHRIESFLVRANFFSVIELKFGSICYISSCTLERYRMNHLNKGKKVALSCAQFMLVQRNSPKIKTYFYIIYDWPLSFLRPTFFSLYGKP